MAQGIKQFIRKHGIESCGRFYGTYVGIVKDIQDPLKANRILINVPEVYGDTAVVRIALPNFGIMGPNFGLHFLPRVGGVVSATFKQGDPDFPYWVPGPYHDEQAPVEFEGSEIIAFKSRTGHMVAIDDENNFITIQHKDGYYIELKEDKITIGNEVRVEIHDKGIDLGKKSDTEELEPAILGNALKDWLETAIDIIKAASLDTPDGPNTGAVNQASTGVLLDTHKGKLNEILAKFDT